jgi:hypothetical protein
MGGAGAVACTPASNDDPPPIATMTGGTDVTFTGTATESPTSTGTDTTGDPTADATTTSSSTGEVPNCDDIVCSGPGTCEIGEDGLPFCACDPGYVLDEPTDTCIVDESCVQLRFLEDRCRQEADGAPAVSLFFALDFCAGTAVLPSKVEELGLQFQVLENGADIEDNVESFATVIPKPVESYVDIVLDVSDSVTEAEFLPMLIEELRTLVASLAPGVDEPDVYVAIHVFGRESAEYVGFTRDLGAVDAALAAIAADPAPVVELAGNGDGTDLYDAVELGINRTQRIRELRDAVTWGGVLSTGTVVVVTDGNDTSNGDLNRGLIDETTNNVISIGISSDIENETLQSIGPDGSFLAPTPADWTTAFAEITRRVDEYPLRSYLLAYCSSATEGDAEVEISVNGAPVTVMSTAICRFDADNFGTDPGDVCDAAFFDNECNYPNACGGLTACGACTDDACCDGATCQAPAAIAGECDGQNDACAPAGLLCEDVQMGTCQPWQPIGTGTCGVGCEPGVAYCDDSGEIEQCVAVRQPGEACEEAQECPELNCQPDNPDNPFDPNECQSGALMFDRCGSDDAVCETGAYCNNVCLPRRGYAQTCGGGDECRSGVCAELAEAGNRCLAVPQCFWSWDSKVPA